MILFVGNSYTFVNDLDVVTTAVFEAGDPGWDEGTKRLARPGLRFVDHVAEAETAGSEWEAALVTGGTWSWMILQEQSQIPGFPLANGERIASRDAAGTLDGYARAHGAETVMLMTWGRREGDAGNPEIYPDYPTMQSALTDGYLDYVSVLSTDERPVWVAPVGLAWAQVYQESPDPSSHASLFWQLYQDDGSHPSPSGTYLAACVLYATMTGRSPVGLPSVLPDAPELQRVAAEVVFEDTPEIAYPWEPGGPVDTDAPDTDDSDAPVDTDVADSDEPNAPACGCQAVGGAGWSLVAILIGLRRRTRGVT